MEPNQPTAASSVAERQQSIPVALQTRKERDESEGVDAPSIPPGPEANSSRISQITNNNINNKTKAGLVEEPDSFEEIKEKEKEKGGKPMGFEDDDATWERFQKSVVSKPAAAVLLPVHTGSVPAASSQKTIGRNLRATSLNPQMQSHSLTPQQTAQILANASKKSLLDNSNNSNSIPPANDSFFTRNKKSSNNKDANWLPMQSIWTQKKALSREEVQVTLFATADILTSSNIPTSYTVFKRQQAANDDSSNFKLLLNSETPTPLRVFEIADRVASGGLIDAELDFPVIGWFLKLVAACPNMCIDESELEDSNIGNNPTLGNIKEDEEPEMNRIVGSGANEISNKMIEDDDVLALTIAKVELDAVASVQNAAVQNNTLKGDVTISIVEEAANVEEKSDDTSSKQISSPQSDSLSRSPHLSTTSPASQFKLYITDEFNGLYVVPATPTMTINEIKQEALHRYGIVDFINRHDIFGVDQDNRDVVLDYLNTPIGSLKRLTNMQFHLRRKKPISWSIPVLIHDKNTYRYVAVNAFTTIEQVTSIVAAMENVGNVDDYAIFNDKERIPPLSTFDPWSKVQEFAFTQISKPFPEIEEQQYPEVRPKPLDAPQEPLFKQSAKSRILEPETSNSVGSNTSSRQLSTTGGSGGGGDTPRANRSTFKARLFGGFGGLKTNKDEQNETDDEEEVHSRPSSNIAPLNRPNSIGKSGSLLPSGGGSSGEFFVSRFYYGNMAYTTLRLQMNATAQLAVNSIMEKLLIKESSEEYGIFVNRKTFDTAMELDKTQDLYSIHKTLTEGEIFLFQRKTKMEAHLRPEATASPHQTFINSIKKDMMSVLQDENISDIPKISGLEDNDEDGSGGEEDGIRASHRPSLSRRISKSVEFLQRKNGLRRWTRSEEAKELCRILALVGKEKEITSEILKPKKMGYQAVPKEGWLVIRDEYEEWVDVWVSVNGNEVKLLLSSLDATTYIIPIANCTVHMRNGPEIGNMRHTFIIGDSATNTSHTMGAKSFSDMEEWVERIKTYVNKAAAGTRAAQGAAAPSDNASEDMTPFQVCRVLGEGESRQVLLCKQKSTKQAYAVKIIPKRSGEKGTAALEMEYKVLRTVKHPFIVKLHAAFESTQQVFLITDYVDGGELYFQISNFGKFPEDRARFYATEILLGLECLHGHRIVYRDLKLENILLNREGHVVISDFGLSRMEPTSDSGKIVGPLEYLAPEVIYGQGSSYSTDWWAFGIILYEMMCGSHPFYSEDRSQMETNILSAPLKFPKHLSANAKSIITGLLARESANRLGSNGGEDILRHAFFAKINPMKLVNREVEPPYKPEIADEKDAQLYEDVHHEAVEEEE
ncbi:UNVERIFIED_CONTAM: Serine/threonine-protein kinase Sgk1 [Siphonaria sp. JEL0065]|nr:Serine/threonine-protein kinase Sgk1 [Siphonaria sp. JEL0065]